MEAKQQDVMAILKLYELRRDEKMRAARVWFFTEFNPTSTEDIARLMMSGEAASANFRMLTSYWEMAASFVNNGGIDEKLFLDANTEHIGVFAKMEPFVTEIREVFGETNYLTQLETLVRKVPNASQIMAARRKLFASWAKAKA